LVEQGDLLQEVRGQWRRPADMDIVDLAAGMGPAGGLLYPTGGVDLVIPGKGIGLQHTAEVLQVCLWMNALAIRRVPEPGGRCCRAAMRSIIANIGPQSTLLRLALAWCQNRHRRVIGVQFARSKHMTV